MYVGAEPVSSLMLGDMGVKTVMLGGAEIYRRPGGYCYITLDTSTKPEIEKEKSNG